MEGWICAEATGMDENGGVQTKENGMQRDGTA